MNNKHIGHQTSQELLKDLEIASPFNSEYLTLEKLFEEAISYGRPSMFCHKDKTWSCHIEMWVNASNVTFKIESGYNHLTPYDALLSAVFTARKALKDLEGSK